MTPELTTPDVPDWQLERFLLGELPPDERERVRRAAEQDTAVGVRLRAIEESDAEILERHSPRAMADRIHARLARVARGRTGAGPRWTVLAAAASLAALASVAGLRHFRQEPAESAETRVKGLRPQLLLFRKAPAAGVERLVQGSVARDHDLLQVAYQAAGRTHGVIVSVDGRGAVTRHLPVSGTQAEPLQTGATVPLPAAYELDDAPGFERFYLVTADSPFPVVIVEDAVRLHHRGGTLGSGHLDLPATMDQFTFVLQKEPTR
jgi:anti-sigma factor RsiW